MINPSETCLPAWWDPVWWLHEAYFMLRRGSAGTYMSMLREPSEEQAIHVAFLGGQAAIGGTLE